MKPNRLAIDFGSLSQDRKFYRVLPDRGGIVSVGHARIDIMPKPIEAAGEFIDSTGRRVYYYCSIHRFSSIFADEFRLYFSKPDYRHAPRLGRR